MEDEKIDKQEVWSAIRYLDPDEPEKDKQANTATIIAIAGMNGDRMVRRCWSSFSFS